MQPKGDSLTQRQKRIIKRRDKLEILAKQGVLFCSFHNFYLCGEDIRKHNCYTGSHGRKYCPYVKVEINDYFCDPFKLIP